MTIQSFIEKAIEGGWNLRFGEINWATYGTGGSTTRIAQDSFLLDPLAWKAVGKVEEKNDRRWGFETCRQGCQYWFDGEGCADDLPPRGKRIPMWQFHMHRMIDALAEGKTIEQYLETL